MASTYKYPENYISWFIKGNHLAVVTTKGSTSTSVHSKLGDWKGIDESVIEGFLIHYMAEPNAVSAITDTPDIDNTLHSFITDFVKCKLYMDRAGQLSISDAFSNMHFYFIESLSFESFLVDESYSP